jgi:hypothetical protein
MPAGDRRLPRCCVYCCRSPATLGWRKDVDLLPSSNRLRGTMLVAKFSLKSKLWKTKPLNK